MEGYTFREVLVSFPKATPIGVEEKATLNVLLNPQDDYIIQPGPPSGLCAVTCNGRVLHVHAKLLTTACTDTH